ncbi:SCO family protein [Bacillus niameyensis]|uniref:SCO family protein n=1 Tax=Bacillus niameyensis TaxID=1522308 RepID=UPI000781F4F9|nr:SCO family protein [Bacillus niameyensis]
MIKSKRNAVSIFLVLLFGSFLFYIGTDGFHAFTAETARVNKLVNDQPKFPELTLEDSKGQKYSISEFQDKYVLVTFFYSSCTTVCVDLEWNMSQVYQMIPSKYLGKEIEFLSITFDPERDTSAILDRYREHFGSDGITWRMARISDQAELDSLLKEFGVIVIPDGSGNFTHNSAFYLLDKNARLIDVMDYTKVEEAANTIEGMLQREMGE